MKRINIFIMIAVLGLLLFVASAFAAAPQVSSWTESTERMADGYRITTWTWTADSTGYVPNRTSSRKIKGVLFQALTMPDSSLVPAVEDSSGRYPSANYDITIESADSLDVMGATLANRSATLTEWTPPKSPDGTEWTFFVNSKMNVKLTNNIIPNARGVIKLFWWEK